MASTSDPTTTMTTTATREPLDTAVRQQRMKAWTPILHPVWVIATLIIIGVTFIPIGIKTNAISDEVVEYKIRYDSYQVNNGDDTVQACGIESANEGKSCLVEYVIKKDMKGPIMVYYEIENFYQNHREYYTSRDDAQVSIFFLKFNTSYIHHNGSVYAFALHLYLMCIPPLFFFF